MTELLFLVARDQIDLVGHLSHEFSGGDVHVLVDRRLAERRHRRGEREHRLDRRSGDRRARRATDHELRSIGYSIVTLEEIEGGRGEAPPPANPTAVRAAADYLRERFPFFAAIPSWDNRREGQGFLLLSREGHPAHRLLFAKEFLDYYGHEGPDRIGRLLDEWKLAQQVEMAGRDLVLVTSYGIRTGDW